MSICCLLSSGGAQLLLAGEAMQAGSCEPCHVGMAVKIWLCFCFGLWVWLTQAAAAERGDSAHLPIHACRHRRLPSWCGSHLSLPAGLRSRSCPLSGCGCLTRLQRWAGREAGLRSLSATALRAWRVSTAGAWRPPPPNARLSWLQHLGFYRPRGPVLHLDLFKLTLGAACSQPSAGPRSGWGLHVWAVAVEWRLCIGALPASARTPILPAFLPLLSALGCWAWCLAGDNLPVHSTVNEVLVQQLANAHIAWVRLNRGRHVDGSCNP